jgi:hypothetical protein
MTLSECRSELRTEPRQFYFRVLQERLTRLMCPSELVSACYELVASESELQGRPARTSAIRSVARFLGILLQIEQIEAGFGVATRKSAQAVLLAFITRGFEEPHESNGSTFSSSAKNRADDRSSMCPPLRRNPV